MSLFNFMSLRRIGEKEVTAWEGINSRPEESRERKWKIFIIKRLLKSRDVEDSGTVKEKQRETVKDGRGYQNSTGLIRNFVQRRVQM